MRTILSFLLSTTCLLPKALGHGRLLEPPSRSSMWRFGYDTPKNYDDNQLFCGGVGVQYSSGVDGKCGVCGDPWNGPRANEPGGRFANGIIVRKYTRGQTINVTIELTANHKGYFEFRLCPAKTPFDKVQQECLDKYVLPDAVTGETRHHITDKGYNLKYQRRLRLPSDVICRACLFQWKYNAGNSWGIGEDGEGCIGCGNQEQFYGCADIAIGYDDVVVGKPVGENPWVNNNNNNKDNDIKPDLENRNRTNTTTKDNHGNRIGSHSVHLVVLLLSISLAIHYRLLS